MSAPYDFPTSPRNDGSEEDCQCARCGSSCSWFDCEQCHDGYVERDSWDGCGEPYETRCEYCRGRGGWWYCCSGADWCEAHPMDDRAHVAQGVVEWFSLPPRPTEAPDPSREFSSVPAQAAVHELSTAAPAPSVSRAPSSNGDDA